MTTTFKILRFDPLEGQAAPFPGLPPRAQAERHGSRSRSRTSATSRTPRSSFRYSCREAVCGSCGMVDQRRRSPWPAGPRSQALDSDVVIIEPLPNLEIQKDLIVDMEPVLGGLPLRPALSPA